MTDGKASDTDAIDEAAARARLLDERRDLTDLSAGASDDRRPVTLDQQSVGRLSRMDAMQGQEMAQAVERRRRARLALVDAALKRLDAGDYGTCVDCGEDIAPGRLRVDAAAARCVACAR